MRCLRHILHIIWQDKVTNNNVLERAIILSMYTLLKQRRMRWLGHVIRMDDGRIPKDFLYGELAQGKRPTGRPQLRYKDVFKRDLKAMDIDLTTREPVAPHKTAWRWTVRKGLSSFEQSLTQQAEAKRKRRKARGQAYRPATDFTCVQCGRDYHSCVGLSSHTRSRRCISITIQRATP